MEPVITNNLIISKMYNLNYVQEFLSKRKIDFKNISRLVNGRNSKVYLIENHEEKFVVKQYHHDPNDGRNRAKTEYEFLNYLSKNNINAVAKPIFYDQDKHINVISFLPGNPPRTISDDLIFKCADFIREINFERFNDDSKILSDASEASDNIFAHINKIGKRINILDNFSNKNIELDYLSRFVQSKMLKCFKVLSEKVAKGFNEEYIKSKLSYQSKILSPSDFGFRNTLVHKDDLYFLDFEYAGWDDPAKLICDFGCQPDIPINNDSLNIFIQSFSDWYTYDDDLKERCDILIPFYRLKWCCIMLNEFTVTGKKRRDYSTGKIDLKNQFIKCNNYFEEHLSGLY